MCAMPAVTIRGYGITMDPAVVKAAQELELDPAQDEQMMWLAEHAARLQLPDEWYSFDDDDGQKAYYHPKTKMLTRQHPVITKYKQFINKIRRFQERMGSVKKKMKPHVAVIFNEVLNRCNKELPPVTPEIVERMALLLNIDTAIDYGLTRRMKTAIDCYAEDQYDLFVQAHQKADMDAFLAEMRNEQVAVEVLNKPEAVIMCSEIEGQPATVKCDQCKDFFSLEGFMKTHSRGKRQDHTTVKCEQVTCSVYPHERATCEVDSMLFCDRAYEEVCQKRPELRRKRKKILGGLACSEYPGRRAELLCEDCSDLYCWEAYIELHRRGNRQYHKSLWLDEDGLLYRKGALIDPEETAMLIDRARMAREGGPWLAFQDDQLSTYWYHLSDKVTTKVNPYFPDKDEDD